MTNKDKQKISTAILCCFLVAFVALSALKFGGIFIFERALDWKIFEFIDSKPWLLTLFAGLLNCIGAYYLCLALNDKPYCDKWWHYLLIFLPTIGITFCRMYLGQSLKMDYIYDIINYIGIPILFALVINNKNHKIKAKLILILFIILMYFCYIGFMNYSIMLVDDVIVQKITNSSSFLLVSFEVYIGLILIMLSINYFIKNTRSIENVKIS